MQLNIGLWDRAVRGILGLFLLFIAVLMNNPFIAIGGLFVLYESLSGWCALYQILGKNTCPVKTVDKKFVFKDFYIKGVKILGMAVLLNIFAFIIGWASWYEFLGNPQNILSWDNYLFLFLIYPIFLGIFV